MGSSLIVSNISGVIRYHIHNVKNKFVKIYRSSIYVYIFFSFSRQNILHVNSDMETRGNLMNSKWKYYRVI